MSQINLKSITGITSITTPAGVDNVFTVHTNDTTERFRVDSNGNQRIAGILTVTQDLDVDGQTNLDHVSIAGVTTVTGEIKIPDLSGSSNKISLGTNQNLQIYYDSSSYITNGTAGHLKIKTLNGGSDIRLESNDDIFLMTAAGTRNSIICRDYAQVELYYNNTKRFETTNTGADINGDLDVSGNISVGATITYEDVTNVDSVGIITARQGIFIDDSITHIGDTNTKIRFPAVDTISMETAGAERLRITSTGTIGINTATPINDFTLLTDGNGYIDFHGSGGKGAEMNVYKKDDKSLTYKFANNGGSNELAQHYLTSAAGKYLWYIGGTSTANEKMRLHNNGYLGIGTDNPQEKLHVHHTGTSCVLVSGTTAPQIRFNPSPADGTDGDRSILGQATGNAQFVNSAVSGDTILRGTSSGSIKFGIGNDEKVRITSSGNLEIINNNDYLKIGNGGLLAMVHTGGEAFITNATGHLTARCSVHKWENSAGSAEYLRIDASGNLILTGTTGNSDPRFTIKHSAADVEGEVVRIARTDLPTIRYHSIKAKNGGAATNNYISFNLHNGGSGSGYTVQSEILRLIGSGGVGIGTAIVGTNVKLDVCNGILRSIGSGSHDTRIEFIRENTGAMGWIGIPNWNDTGLYIYGPTATSNEIAASYGDSAWNFFTGGDSSRKIRVDSGGRSLFRTNGSQTSPIVDNNIPVQIAESTGDMCYFGANKGNDYGSLFGHHTAYGGTVIRNVRTDDIVFYTNNTVERLRIDHSANNVTVKNSEFQVHENELQISSSNSYATHFNYQDNGSHYISMANTGATQFRRSQSGGTVLTVFGSGSATLSGSLTQNASDIKLKENIQPITNSLEKVKSLSGFTYNWNKKAQDIGFKGEHYDELQVGLSAQDVEKIQPEVVKPAPADNNFKTIQYEKLVPLLVEAIKEQQEQIEILKSEVNALKG